MNKTKIETFDKTWNPVTGCLRGCDYCYARGIARRFAGFDETSVDLDPIQKYVNMLDGTEQILHALKNHATITRFDKYDTAKTYIAPYPFGFNPTFHHYRLDEPQKCKKPSNIFVCSMADLFGDWVSNEWIEEVFKACEAAPQHRYLFLTKNPKRYIELEKKGLLPQGKNYWYGSTVTGEYEPIMWSDKHNTFVSIEPLLSPFTDSDTNVLTNDWVIIGAESGNRKNKVIPPREWIENIVEQCLAANVPVFMKNSLVSIIGEENMLREFPWERVITVNE